MGHKSPGIRPSQTHKEQSSKSIMETSERAEGAGRGQMDFK